MKITKNNPCPYSGTLLRVVLAASCCSPAFSADMWVNPNLDTLLKISVRKQALGRFLLERHGETQAFEPRHGLTLEAPRLDPVEVVRP
jgi:hypothetical protein